MKPALWIVLGIVVGMGVASMWRSIAGSGADSAAECAALRAELRERDERIGDLEAKVAQAERDVSRGTPAERVPVSVPSLDHTELGSGRELESLRSALAEREARIASLEADLRLSREEPITDLRNRWHATELAQSLSEEDRNRLFSYFVQPTRRFPKPELAEPLLDSIRRYRTEITDVERRLYDDPGAPGMDPDDPLTLQLREKQEAVRERFFLEISTILRDDRVAVSEIFADW